MKISFYDKVQLATHIERKVSSMNICGEGLEEDVYEDIEKQIKREFGLNRKHPNLDEKYLFDAHELVDAYEVPKYLQEMIDDANSQMSLAV